MSSSQSLRRKRKLYRRPTFSLVPPKRASLATIWSNVGEAGCEAATHWLDLNDKFAETERELPWPAIRVLDVIRPWHEDSCAKRKAHESTVVVETPTGALRVSFQHRYTKLALDREEHPRQLFGDDFERYFKRTVSLKVKKEVAEDPERRMRWLSPWPRRSGSTTLAAG